MKWFFSVYKQYIRISFSSAAAYRTNFFFMVLISLFSNLLIPLLTVLIYAGGMQIPGWSFAEAMMIQSVFMLCTGICAPFFNNMIWITMQHIREGTFDLIMLKPGPVVFLVAASAFDIENIGMLLGGAVMFIYSICKLPAIPLTGNWVQFILLLFMGIIMTLGCILLMTATTFKWVGNSRIYEIFDAVTMFGRYPGSIFGRILQGVGAYAIPVFMMGYFPAAAILGRADINMMLAGIPCITFFLFGLFIFRRMIYLYQSAGG